MSSQLSDRSKVATIQICIAVVCYLAFDVRMRAFGASESEPNSRSSKLIQAAEDANSCLIPLDQGVPIWHHFETPTYRKFRLAQEYLESVAIEFVNQKIAFFDEGNVDANNRENKRRSLLDDYLSNPKLDLSDVVGMGCDLLLTGVDTVFEHEPYAARFVSVLWLFFWFLQMCRQHTRNVSYSTTWQGIPKLKREYSPKREKSFLTTSGIPSRATT